MTDQLPAAKLSPRLTDLLDGGDELLDVVLRGHLHVEQLLLSMIEHWASSPRYVTEARLSFGQKLSIARAFNLHHPNEPIWNALAALNSLRNDLAHRLTSDQREKKIAAFIEFTEQDSAPIRGDRGDKRYRSHDQLLACFAYLFGCLQAMGDEYAARASVAKTAGKHMDPKTASGGGNA
jgi:hypothetical protein